MNSFRFYCLCLLVFACLLESCSSENELAGINTKEQSSWVNIPVRDDLTLSSLVVVPAGKGPHPAIVVLHGCGGLLKDPETNELESHFLDWVHFGLAHKVVMVFPDSYNPRGFSEFCSFGPPEDAVCSPAYERPKDAYAVLQWLSTQNYIDIDRIGLLGFSHGGSTAISSVYRNPQTDTKNWTVQNNGETYNVPAPAPKGLEFKAAVAYYPGAGFYGYFGDDYLPYTPLLIHAASLDPLYTSGNTTSLVNTAILNGADLKTNNEVLLYVYEGASHSFDGAQSGVDQQADVLAKQRTLDWFKNYLKF